MENEIRVRIANVKETCKVIDRNLHERYELMKGSTTPSERNEVVLDVIEIQSLYRNVNASNIDESEKQLIKMEEQLIEKYGLSIIDGTYVEPLEDMNASEEETIEEKPDGKKSVVGAVLGGVVAGSLLTGAVGYAICSNKHKNTNKSNIATFAEETNTKEEKEIEVENFEKIDDEAKTESEKVTEAIDLVLGEYGTFLDVTNDEQVEARAQYLYDNYYAKFADKLCESDKALLSVEEIANTIRVVNGQLPKDENGCSFMDASVTDYYMNRFIDFVGNVPSCDVMGTVEYVPAHLFAIDGSKTSEFIKSYDEIYKNIAEARNTRNGEMFYKNAKIMAAKYWTEWFLQGMYGNIVYDNTTGELSYSEEAPKDSNLDVITVQDPYALNETFKYFAYCATMYRYSTFIYEGEHNQMSTVCIPACINYSTKDMDELSIDQIYTAIDTGVWNNIIARTAGMDAPVDPVCVGFWESLNDQLMFNYEHNNTLQLK